MDTTDVTPLLQPPPEGSTKASITLRSTHSLSATWIKVSFNSLSANFSKSDDQAECSFAVWTHSSTNSVIFRQVWQQVMVWRVFNTCSACKTLLAAKELLKPKPAFHKNCRCWITPTALPQLSDSISLSFPFFRQEAFWLQLTQASDRW